MKIIYTKYSAKGLIPLREFIREKNPKAAQKISHQFKDDVQMLEATRNW